METKEDYIKEAERLVDLDVKRTSDEPRVEFPHWLKIEPGTLQYYFKWTTQGFTKGVGWWWDTEIVTIGGKL